MVDAISLPRRPDVAAEQGSIRVENKHRNKPSRRVAVPRRANRLQELQRLLRDPTTSDAAEVVMYLSHLTPCLRDKVIDISVMAQHLRDGRCPACQMLVYLAAMPFPYKDVSYWYAGGVCRTGYSLALTAIRYEGLYLPVKLYEIGGAYPAEFCSAPVAPKRDGVVLAPEVLAPEVPVLFPPSPLTMH